jgi:hypothetical protein
VDSSQRSPTPSTPCAALLCAARRPLYLFLFTLSVSLFFMTIYPTLIQPLFNKFEPLPEGPLRDAIEALASSLHFPLTKLYTMVGGAHTHSSTCTCAPRSPRSTHHPVHAHALWAPRVHSGA